MDWRDRTTMERGANDEFDTVLAHVTVSDRGVRVAFKDVEDWKRIDREVGDDIVLREVYWDEVAGIDATTEHLYYMHVDLDVEMEDGETVERRIYFLEDEDELLDDCLTALRRAWNAFQQRHASPGGTYSYAAVDATEGEVELEDPDAQIRVEESAGGADQAAEEETPDAAAVAEAKKLVEKTRDKLHGTKERLSGGSEEADDRDTEDGEADRDEGAGQDRDGEAEDGTDEEDPDREDDQEEDGVEDIVDDFLRD